MPIPLSDFQNPRFIRYEEGPTLSRDTNALFDAMPYGGSNMRAWRQSPQPGYNSNYPSTQIVRLNYDREDLDIPPMAR